jgi:carboxypeptidase Taq
MALIARLTHELGTSQEVGDLLAACEADDDLVGDPYSDTAVTLERLRHDYDRATCIPSSLVSEEAMLASSAQHNWAEARRNDDFSQFQPYLERVVALLRRRICSID